MCRTTGERGVHLFLFGNLLAKELDEVNVNKQTKKEAATECQMQRFPLFASHIHTVNWMQSKVIFFAHEVCANSGGDVASVIICGHGFNLLENNHFA